MNPLTRVRITIAREFIQAALLAYAALILFTHSETPSVLLAGCGVSIVGALLLGHAVAVSLGYPALKRRIKAATGG